MTDTERRKMYFRLSRYRCFSRKTRHFYRKEYCKAVIRALRQHGFIIAPKM